MSDQIRYTLEKPIQFTASRRVEELAFKTDLTVKELRRLDAVTGSVSTGATILAIMSGEPVELIDAMSSADFFKAQEMLKPFLKDILGTGAP